jgi:hypothetical protein
MSDTSVHVRAWRIVCCGLQLAFCAWNALGANAQGNGLEFGGYVKYSPLLVESPFLSGGDAASWKLWHLMYNRLSIRYSPLEWLSVSAELLNSVSRGSLQSSPLAGLDPQSIRSPAGNLTHVWLENGETTAKSSFNRLATECEAGSFRCIVGRQRIVWGLNLVWNPIDLFNPTSPLSLDKEEQPGVDAIRAEWFPGAASRVEMVFSPGATGDEQVFAGLLRWDVAGYDFQIVAGREQTRFVAGVGWAGEIGGGGFRGEALYRGTRASSAQAVLIGSGAGESFLTAALSGDYTFANSLYLHLEALYNSAGEREAAGKRYAAAQFNGELSPGQSSLFAEVSYRFSALLDGRLSLICNPGDASVMVGPSVTWSAFENVDVTGTALLGSGSPASEFGDLGKVVVLRCKWSF